MRLEGQVALVTGGGSGIGRAIAESYSREGCRVVIADIDAAAGESVAGGIRATVGDAYFIRTDVSQSADVQALVAGTIDRYTRISILVNCAAIELFDRDGRAHELSEAAWDRTIDINLKGYWLCSKYVIPHMLRQGGGTIIHIASPTGLRAQPGETAYSTSKGGVAALTRTMAVDYARDNIRVNAIVPGFTDTPLVRSLLNEQVRVEASSSIPAGRLGTPDDLSGMAIFLASDEARYCIGGFYMVDGGMMAQ